MLSEGYNLNFDGRDFHSYPGKSLKEKFKNCYLDDSKPFGHELCLCAMLLLKETDLPWR